MVKMGSLSTSLPPSLPNSEFSEGTKKKGFGMKPYAVDLNFGKRTCELDLRDP